MSIDHGSYALNTVDRKSHWYDIVHASVAVKPGAVRIGTKGHTASGVTYLAFRNPDQSYGVLILNESASAQQFVFATDAHSVTVDVPAQAVVSATWKD